MESKENANYVHIVYLLVTLCNIYGEAFFIDVSIDPMSSIILLCRYRLELLNVTLEKRFIITADDRCTRPVIAQMRIFTLIYSPHKYSILIAKHSHVLWLFHNKGFQYNWRLPCQVHEYIRCPFHNLT